MPCCCSKVTITAMGKVRMDGIKASNDMATLGGRQVVRSN